MREGASSAQPIDINMFPCGRPEQEHPPGLVTETDPCCCRATNQEMTIGNSSNQDLTMTLGVSPGMYIGLCLTVPGVCSFSSPHCAPLLLFHLLFHLSTTYLLILVAPRESECLASSPEFYSLFVLCSTMLGVISILPCLHRPCGPSQW